MTKETLLHRLSMWLHRRFHADKNVLDPEQPTSQGQSFSFSICLLGDSLISISVLGFDLLDRIRKNCRTNPDCLLFMNCGKNGDNVIDIRSRLPSVLASTSFTDHNPRDTLYIIFFDSDISDMGEEILSSTTNFETAKLTYSQNLASLVSSIKERGHDVVICSPGLLYDPRKSSILDEYSHINMEVAKQHGIRFLDIRSVFLDMLDKGIDPTVDGEHLNEHGCEAAATLFANAIDDWIERKSK